MKRTEINIIHTQDEKGGVLDLKVVGKMSVLEIIGLLAVAKQKVLEQQSQLDQNARLFK